MENQEIKTKSNHDNKTLVGVLILVVGLVLLTRELGLNLAPNWLFTWPMILIIVGVAGGIKNKFKKGGWFFPLLVGSIFLIEKISPELSVHHFTWPLFIIGVGLWFLFGRNLTNNKRKWRNEDEFKQTDNHFAEDISNSTENDFLDSVSIFGGTKKIILSKNFKGGSIVNIFGGAEINLIQADVNSIAILDVTQIFGGTKIYVPSNWDVKSEIVPIFGGIDDKRPLPQSLPENRKVLVLKGISIFGGVDIRNF